MQRVPEPELMEDLEQASAYSKADFSGSNQLFVQYIQDHTRDTIQNVLDLGCGPGDVDIELASQLKDVRITAMDGSKAMVDIGRKKIKDYQLDTHIDVQQGKIPNLAVEPGQYDVIISKDLLHHLPDAGILWQEMDRLSHDQTYIVVMDLIRPDTEQEAQRIVADIASTEPEVLQQDFYHSLFAAYTMDEIQEQMNQYPFHYSLEKIGGRHFILTCCKSPLSSFSFTKQTS